MKDVCKKSWELLFNFLKKLGSYASGVGIIVVSMGLAVATAELLETNDPWLLSFFIVLYLFVGGVSTGKLKKYRFKAWFFEIENKGTRRYSPEDTHVHCDDEHGSGHDSTGDGTEEDSE